MTTSHPEVRDKVAQRACAQGPENVWTVYGRTEDLINGDDPRPALILQWDRDPGRFWALGGMSADAFWEMFVRVP
jgi:hypothetical protein